MRLGVEEWERWATWVGDICGAVAGALLRQSRDVAEALSEMFLVAPCALSEGRAQSLELLQYSQYCHRSLIRTRCGGGFFSDFTTGNENKMVVFSHFLRF